MAAPIPPSTPSGAQSGASLVPEPANHPHAGFHALLPIVGQAFFHHEDPGPLLGMMSSYVSALAWDDWFDTHWNALLQRAEREGISRTGLAGGMPLLTFRQRQYRLIMRGARRYHILENGNAPGSSWQKGDEKILRLRGKPSKTQPRPSEEENDEPPQEEDEE